MKSIVGTVIGFLFGTVLILAGWWLVGKQPSSWFAAYSLISFFTFIGWLVGKTWDHK